jgi:hypothetical protein
MPELDPLVPKSKVIKTILELGLFQLVAYFYVHRDCIHCIYVLFSNFD